ncbi:beta-lactamase-like protein [Mycena rebaudengoi]|nr:beta-lactamase-like protein [Mycena rebaudengoi]
MSAWPLLALFVASCTATLGIPSSSSTVNVRAFNVATMNVRGAQIQYQPILPGRETARIPIYAFLVEHTVGTKKTRVMFDVGMRPDVQNLPPSVLSFFQSGALGVDPFKDITQLLTEGGIPLDTIDTVIWSHSHFDHIADMSKFPNTTKLVVGPGTDRRTYPEFPDASLLTSDLAGRNVTELSFTSVNLTIRGLPALDFFGDGSFYLLNTPGHLPGHMTALARVTSSTFVLLGADSGHHVGQIRPTHDLQRAVPCPAHILANSKAAVSTDFFWSSDSQPGAFDLASRAQPLLSIPDLPNTVMFDPVAARVSLAKVADFDADSSVLVVFAHDESLIHVLPYFPKTLNAWKASGIKSDAVWGFLDTKNPAFRFGKA